MIIDLNRKQNIHFVGIGGIGMSGIAEVLLNKGQHISGSDICDTSVTQHLKNLGAKIDIGHHKDHINGANIVVVSSMITMDNVEIIAAKDKGIQIVHRANMLAALMEAQNSIAISGTHGKTTTTSLVSSILAEAGKDPTFVIGGILKSAGSNARLGKSKYFVAEADESDASFLLLHPQHVIVTNIDADHLSTFGGDFSKLQDAFIQFIENVPQKGSRILCVDDPGILEILPRLKCSYIGYGFSDKADIQVSNYEQKGMQSHFTVTHKLKNKSWNVTLNIPGKHNVLNAVSTIMLSLELGIEPEVIFQALKTFGGVGRRFQILGEISAANGKATVVDDYGHHPNEVAAVIDTARHVWPDRRIVMVYQPHRFSRTQELFNEFVDVLKRVDLLLLADIYPAGEKPIPGITGESLFEEIVNQATHTPIFIKDLATLPSTLTRVLNEGDILFMQGAGSIGKMAQELIK